MLTENLIRERAYLLWEQAGQPDGTGEEFWFAAVESVAAEATAKPAKAPRKAAPAKKSAGTGRATGKVALAAAAGV